MALDLLGVFSAGLLTFVTPCVLPLIPIYLSALVGADIRTLDRMGRGQLVLRAFAFAVGFVLVFMALGLTASSLGTFLVDHKAAVQAFGAVLILLFGLKFLGVITIPALDRTLRADSTKVSTRVSSFNAFFMGIVFAAGWSPCVGPVLGSVLTYTASSTSSPLTGALYLTVYGLGFAAPLLLLAVFAEAGLAFLQKLTTHMRKVEVVLGVGLVVLAVTMTLDALPRPAPPRLSVETASATPATLAPAPTMLVFSSPTCPICQRMKPIVDGLVAQCDGNKVRVRIVDTSKSQSRALARAYRLVGLPTFVFEESNGDEVARLVGEQTEDTLRRALSALRGEPCPGLAIIERDGSHLHEPDEQKPTPDEQKPTACPPNLDAEQGAAQTCGGA